MYLNNPGLSENRIKVRKGIRYYNSFYKARDIANNLKGYPAARVVQYELGFAIQYYPSGPYYPELKK